MTHWHVVMLRVTGDGADGRHFAVRQVEIEYPSPDAAAAVLVDLYERQFARPLAPEQRRGMIRHYADHPNMSTEPHTPDDNGDLLAIVACDAEGESCIDSANAWGQQKIAMRKALGIW